MYQELSNSRHLCTKGLHHIVAGMVPLAFGGVNQLHEMLTAATYDTLPVQQRQYTAWIREPSRNGGYKYLFSHHPSWLHCRGTQGLGFIIATCSDEDEWQVLSFISLLAHEQCLFCLHPGFLGHDQWQHLLCDCTVAREISVYVGLGFAP